MMETHVLSRLVFMVIFPRLLHCELLQNTIREMTFVKNFHAVTEDLEKIGFVAVLNHHCLTKYRYGENETIHSDFN